MRLRTFDDGGDIVKGPRRRYQGSMSTSLPADEYGRLYHNRLLPCGVQKETATAATEAKRRCGRTTLSVATSATLPAHRAAFGRDRRDPPDASHSFRSRQARPSRRITQLSVATSATLPAHHAAFGRDKRDPPGASRSVRSRQARPSWRIAQRSVATSATLPAQPHCGRATLSVATSATLPAHHEVRPAPGAARVLRVPSRTCRAVRAKSGNRPCGDQALATLIFAAWPLRSQEAASGHAANESAVASVSAFT